MFEQSSHDLPFIGFWPALLLGFAHALFIGFVNGIIITRLQIPAFIAPLATALLVGGLILLATGGAPIYYPNPFYADFGNTAVLGVPTPVYIFATVTLICAWLLNQTAFGKSSTLSAAANVRPVIQAFASSGYA